MVTQERHHTPDMLQPGLIHVEIHPIDALDLQGHMPGKDIRGTTSYGHRRAPVDTGPLRPTNRFGRFKAGPKGPASRLDRSLQTHPTGRHH